MGIHYSIYLWFYGSSYRITDITVIDRSKRTLIGRMRLRKRIEDS